MEIYLVLIVLIVAVAFVAGMYSYNNTIAHPVHAGLFVGLIPILIVTLLWMYDATAPTDFTDTPIATTGTE